jgi:hypothetical protein
MTRRKYVVGNYAGVFLLFLMLPDLSSDARIIQMAEVKAIPFDVEGG